MSHAGNPHRYQHNPVRIPPPPLFGAPPLPNCFDAAAPLNLETLERRWKAFGTSELPFSKDQKIQKNHWFWIWKDKTWEELVRGLTRLNERKTVNSYIQTFCDYLRRLGGYVRGGQIADRNCFFKEFVPDFRVVQEQPGSEIGDSAILTMRVLFKIVPNTCHFETSFRPILKAALQRSSPSLSEEEKNFVKDSFRRFCIRSELVLADWGFKSSEHEQALASYGIAFVSEMPGRLSYEQIMRLLQISPDDVRKGINLYLAPKFHIKLPLEPGNHHLPANLVHSLNPFESGTPPGIREALEDPVDADRMEHSLAVRSRFTSRQRVVYDIWYCERFSVRPEPALTVLSP